MSNLLFSQTNLIVNGNCDSISNCPDQLNQIEYCYGWERFSIINTPDVLNVCGTTPFTTIPSDFGNQIPNSGNGYLHILPLLISKNFIFNSTYYSVADTIVEYRESFIGTLKMPLEAKRYSFECYINYSNFSQYGYDKRLAINSFDIKFLDSIEHPLTTTITHMDTTGILNLNPDNLIIDDTLNWLKLSICYDARGGEKYFAIGCMRDSSLISYTYSGDISEDVPFFASYYFDSFSLIKCDTCCGNISPIEPFNESLDIANSAGGGAKPVIFTAHLLEDGFAKIEIFDCRGRIVERYAFSKDENTFTPSINLQMAVYHYRFETINGFQKTGKIVIIE